VAWKCPVPLGNRPAAQAPRAARLALANEVIYNAGTLAALASRVQELHALYLRLARAA
jgi:dephospho-CoA kinase